MAECDFDTLIIGQGLAGSALAWHLIHAGQQVCVLDDQRRGSASQIAAGLINPLAGLRFNRHPRLVEWLTSAERWYGELTATLGQRFFHPLPMLRLFRSTEQQRFHARRRDDPNSRDLLDERFERSCPEPVAAPFGGFLQHKTGYVDLPLLLRDIADWLRRHDALREANVAANAVVAHGNGVEVDGLRARRLVFCDGARLRQNHWFAYLPLQPQKGEIVDLRDADWQPRHIINAAHWLVPQSDGTLRFGATHQHQFGHDCPSQSGLEQLLAGWRALRPDTATPSVIGHQAGLRPTTADRNPLIGSHPNHAQLAVCNGFGARGSLSIPWYTEQLAAHLINHTPLPVEADIGRFAP